MKILITGSKGQLGRELTELSEKYNFNTTAIDIEELDITKSGKVNSLFASISPELVINVAAYTNVEKAETEKETAFAVNKTGAANLAQACSLIDIPLIHVSTDYVFDGKKESGYMETDHVGPVSIYGQSKEQGEEEIRSKLKKHIIIRTSWLYGTHGPNFVKTMLCLGADKKELNIVSDQHGNPTSAPDLAEAILDVSKQIQNEKSNNWGTYHYTNEGNTTWYGFAREIFKIAHSLTELKIETVNPITSEEYQTMASRPAYSILNCSKINSNFGVKLKPWKQSLQKVLYSILSE